MYLAAFAFPVSSDDTNKSPILTWFDTFTWAIPETNTFISFDLFSSAILIPFK